MRRPCGAQRVPCLGATFGVPYLPDFSRREFVPLETKRADAYEMNIDEIAVGTYYASHRPLGHRTISLDSGDTRDDLSAMREVHRQRIDV